MGLCSIALWNNYMILGLITFIVGIVARVNGSFGILDAHIPAVHAGANLLIAVGFFIMLMGFLGCCGAIRESQCLLFLFFAFVFFCFTLLMAAGLWAVAWSSKFGCCGVTSAADYGTRSPPKSCTVSKSIQTYSRVSLFYKYSLSFKTDEFTDQLVMCTTKLIEYALSKNCNRYRFVSYVISVNNLLGRDETRKYEACKGCHEVLVEACRSNLSVICGVGISFALILTKESSADFLKSLECLDRLNDSACMGLVVKP
ncbi:CD9 antigen [Schistosoma japonicum]|nr:CD9 antigen [Schistosoma japonicum]